jgi:hypothetical protein
MNPTSVPKLAARATYARPSKPKVNKAKNPPDDNDDSTFFHDKKKMLVGALAAVMVLFLVYWFYPASSAVALAASKLTATDLLQDFVKDRAAADRKYGNRLIMVSGEVVEVSTAKAPCVRFKGPEQATAFVEATFSNLNDVRDIQKYQNITVFGECEGLLDNRVWISMSKVVSGGD